MDQTAWFNSRKGAIASSSGSNRKPLTLRYALQAHSLFPNLSAERVSVGLGKGKGYIDAVFARDPHKDDPKKSFRAQWDRAARVGLGLDRPDPGPFIDWRKSYVNSEVQNPYTMKTALVGETHPYMENFCRALEDPGKHRIMALWPVRHAKSAILEQFVVWFLCRNPNARVLFLASNKDMAEDRAAAIQTILESEDFYPDLHEKWGPWIGKPELSSLPWARTKFTVRGRTQAHRDPSVRAQGIRSRIYGKRADLIILDDVDDPESKEEDRNGVWRKIHSVLVNRLDKGGKLVYIGTRCGPQDIASRLLGHPHYTGENGFTEVLRAIQDDGTALCPQMYDLPELETFREEVGEELFELTYQNNVIGVGDALFPPEVVDMAKGAFDDAPEDWPRIVSLDPASAGRAAIVAVAHNVSTGEIRVLDAQARRSPGHDGLFEMVRVFCAKHKPKTVIIEAQGGSHLFSDVPAVRDYITYEAGADIHPFKTGSNKNDPRFGIGQIARLMRMEKLRLAWSDPARLRVLVDDLLSFQPVFTNRKRYDLVMALWFAVDVITRGRQSKSSNITFINPVVANRPWMMRRRVG